MYWFFCFFGLLKCQKDREIEVLEVIEADKIVLDLNFNHIKDENEIFQIDGIEVFSLKNALDNGKKA